MTDANLMDALCVHGNVWYECPPCDEETKKQFAEDELKDAQDAFPNHAPQTALANYRAKREVWDTNGDMW